MSIIRQFIRYVSFNMLSMVGMSCYILADTLFIANGAGVNGLTALNIDLPLYNIIFAIGLLLGVGGATRYSILQARGESQRANLYFNYAFIIGIVLSIPIMLIGYVEADMVVSLLGANSEILDLCVIYLRGFILFTPFFILSQIMTAFIRNDKDPRLASIASFTGAVFNIVLDYILVFPCHLGILGAALATAFSPVMELIICSFHFFSKKNNLHFMIPSFIFKELRKMVTIGIPVFITELSSGIVIFAFNSAILAVSDNVAVASYGIICNVGVFFTCFYNGISQGVQPLLSSSLGAKEYKNLRSYFKYAIITSLLVSIVILSITLAIPDQIIALFNSENNIAMASIAKEAMPIYFSALFFIGINLIMVSYFTSISKVVPSTIISVLRGGVVVIPLIILLIPFLGLTGVWLSYPLSEFIIMLIGLVLYHQYQYAH